MKETRDPARFHLNLLDFFIIALAILTGLTAFYTFVRPVHFSNAIKREATAGFAEVEILLPEDLQWMKSVLPVGEEKQDGYDALEWKVLEVGEEEVLPGQKRAKVKLKTQVYLESSGVPRYGKYPLVLGSEIIYANNRFLLRGRVVRFKILNEKVVV